MTCLNIDTKIPIQGMLFSLVYLYQPFSVLFLFHLSILLQRNISSSTIKIYFLLLAISLGLINSTKIPESDLINYYDYFLNAGNYSLVNYLILYGKEPLYYIYNYLFYHISGGNTQTFMVFTTIIGYWFFFQAIYKYLKALNAKQDVIIFSIVIAAFFPQLFSLSAHLIRQFLAASIVFYAIVQKLFYKKTALPLLLIAAFTHSTAWLFLPLVYLKPLQRKLGLINITIIIVFVGLLGSFLQIISNKIVSILGSNFITYVFIRLTQQTYVELDSLPLLSFFLLGALLIIAFYFQYKEHKTNFYHPAIKHFLNIFICFFIVLLTFINHSELLVRFFFYTYFFLPFILPLVLNQQNIYYYSTRLFIMLTMVAFFFYKLEHGIWEYAPIINIATFNIYKLYI